MGVFSKVIEWGHTNIRPKQSGAASEAAETERRAKGLYKVGDSIEIFSNTSKQWCKGKVIEVEGPPEQGAMTNCAYTTSSGVEMAKKIAIGHANLRFDKDAGELKQKAKDSLTKANQDGRLGDSLREHSKPKEQSSLRE